MGKIVGLIPQPVKEVKTSEQVEKPAQKPSNKSVKSEK